MIVTVLRRVTLRRVALNSTADRSLSVFCVALHDLNFPTVVLAAQLTGNQRQPGACSGKGRRIHGRNPSELNAVWQLFIERIRNRLSHHTKLQLCDFRDEGLARRLRFEISPMKEWAWRYQIVPLTTQHSEDFAINISLLTRLSRQCCVCSALFRPVDSHCVLRVLRGFNWTLSPPARRASRTPGSSRGGNPVSAPT
jgi:hypothetical protein